MQNDCIFCKIIREELPSSQVYADDAVIAFLDIAPTAKGHTLIVPRKHYTTVFDVPPDLGPALLSATRQVGAALMRGLGAEGVNVMQNNHPAAGQVVFHVHWHIIPRFTGDGLSLWPQSAYASMEEMRETAARIASRISE
jgi:histidine triad (HIT) family protein